MVKPKYSCYSSSSSKVTMGRDSHVISKVKPRIRIIHIYSPEIIKTDAANFRELVQRLTGKPREKEKIKTKTESPRSSKDSIILHPSMVDVEEPKEFRSLQNEEGLMNEDNQEADMWRIPTANNEKSIGGFSDFDSFFEELSELPVPH